MKCDSVLAFGILMLFFGHIFITFFFFSCVFVLNVFPYLSCVLHLSLFSVIVYFFVMSVLILCE